MKFWGPKLFAYCGLLVAIFYNYTWIKIALIVFLCSHVLYFQRNEITKFIELLFNKLKRKNLN
jgi:hypothetical protein